MEYTHKLIISGKPFQWFKRYGDAHRKPNGGIYEIDTQRLVGQYPQLKARQEAMDAALFLLVDVPDEPGEYFLTIVDRASITDINKYRWAPREDGGKNYWYTQHTDFNRLHQYVVHLSGLIPGNQVVHHHTYYTFDNRRDSLSLVTPKDHGRLHRGIKIIDTVKIENDEKFIDFIESVF